MLYRNIGGVSEEGYRGICRVRVISHSFSIFPLFLFLFACVLELSPSLLSTTEWKYHIIKEIEGEEYCSCVGAV
jgi:hypothetical protein